MILEKVFQICPPGEDCTHRHSWLRDITVDPDGRIIIAESREQQIDIERVVVLDQDL